MRKLHLPKAVVVLGIAAVALIAVSTMAHAQGVMFVKNNRVGIGVANPTVAFHIVNPSNPTGDSFAGMGQDPNPAGGIGMNFGYGPSVGGGFFNTRSGGFTNLSFATNNLVRLKVLGSNGNMVFGTSVLAAADPTNPLVHNDSGAFLSAAGVWTDASSRELKHNITELSPDTALATLRDLSPMTYEYHAEPGEGYVGFIAEDVPDLVATSNRKTLAPMDIVAVLTKVVQEQQSTIDELSQRLAELEDR